VGMEVRKLVSRLDWLKVLNFRSGTHQLVNKPTNSFVYNIYTISCVFMRLLSAHISTLILICAPLASILRTDVPRYWELNDLPLWC
jgi:hypothetical protein